MKTTLLLLLVFPLLTFGQSNSTLSGNLRAEVSGDTVLISQDSAFRNCGALYEMLVWFEGDTLIWLQHDIGVSAYCYCQFNLSVTIDSLNAGHYIASAYYTPSPNSQPPYLDKSYQGSFTFDISGQTSGQTYRKVGQKQSDCLQVGLTENNFANSFAVFPNPTTQLINVNYNTQDERIISLYDIKNECFFEMKTSSKVNKIDLGAYPQGVYFLVVRSQRACHTTKIVKL